MINDLPTLLWVVNSRPSNFTPTLASLPDLASPNFVAFDLDPGEGADLRDCCEVALLIRKLLAFHGLESFPKSSGQKGLHVYVPVNRSARFEQTKAFARRVALSLERSHPDLVTSRMPKNFRTGRVFIDWSQNTDFKTTITVYSLRAVSRPAVSTPVSWAEIEYGSRLRRGADALKFGPDEVLFRVSRLGDLFAPVLSLEQTLPAGIDPSDQTM